MDKGQGGNLVISVSSQRGVNASKMCMGHAHRMAAALMHAVGLK